MVELVSMEARRFGDEKFADERRLKGLEQMNHPATQAIIGGALNRLATTHGKVVDISPLAAQKRETSGKEEWLVGPAGLEPAT